MSQYQPFFVAFAHAHGKTPDAANVPGLGVDFVPWIGRAWRDYFAAIGRPENDKRREDDFPGFTAWLERTYPPAALPQETDPALIARIRVSGGKLDGHVVEVRGGPVHVSEVIPEVLDRIGASETVGRWLPKDPATAGEVATPAVPSGSHLEKPAA